MKINDLYEFIADKPTVDWKIQDDENVVVKFSTPNTYSGTVKIQKDVDGNKYFILPNPYIDMEFYDEIDKDIVNEYIGAPNLAYRAVDDCFADTLMKISDICSRLVPIKYLDYDVCKKQKELYFSTWKKNLKGFHYEIEGIKGDDFMFCDSDGNILKFSTRNEAFDFILKYQRKANEIYEKSKKMNKGEKFQFFDIVYKDAKKDGTKFVLYHLLKDADKEEDDELYVNFPCVADFN